MVRETFERELQRLEDEVLVLGSQVGRVLSASVDCLKQRDNEQAKEIIAGDRALNEKRFEIEDAALALIATQQPIARDLRTIAAILEITTELERIGDYAKGIAKINLMIGEETLIKTLVEIPEMADRARDMLQQALEAFVNRDVESARAIPAEDDEVDALYNQVYRDLLDCVIEDQSTIEQSNFLLWVSHNLERTADRVINICERVVFTVTGEMIEMDGTETESLGIESVS